MCERNRGVKIKSTEELFNMLELEVISQRCGRKRKSSRAHIIIIDSVRAGLLPAVADGPNVFFLISLEEVYGTENILVPFGASKGRTAFVVGLGSDLFFFSALGERGNGMLPARLGRVGLRSPYGGQKAARWRRDVLQDGEEWLRRPHDDGGEM